MAVKALPAILSVEPYKGGESTLPGFTKPIKLASNENPWGASPTAKAALLAAAESLALYPDGSARALREAIGGRHRIAPDQIMCGAGSDEIFQLLARAFLAAGDEIVQTEYAFLVYRLVAQQSGAVVRTARDRAFTADVDAILGCVTARTKIVFLANPNNPTGTYLPASEVARLHAGLQDDILLVLDGAYAEYVDAADYDCGLALAQTQANVLVTRTFSKIHGLASLRLGWGYGAPDLIDALNRARGPFNVSALAMAAGAAAIADDAFAAESAAQNRVERGKLEVALEGLGIAFTPSVANFVLAHFPPEGRETAAAADAFLRTQGIIVRRVGAYGLADALRLSVGAAHQNDALIAALRAFKA